ncbi:MAG: carboxypeptidase regulatory-like domain-containing protein [Candidatus Hydrogenedentes bacterium]|nr:carboxypeptidase regulatory-like domain-containing protein [Candidatus Hydrogenedentota bacterium]
MNPVTRQRGRTFAIAMVLVALLVVLVSVVGYYWEVYRWNKLQVLPASWTVGQDRTPSDSPPAPTYDTVTATATLSTVPFSGSISGKVYLPSGATPSEAAVRLFTVVLSKGPETTDLPSASSPGKLSEAATVLTVQDGQFEFTSLAKGRYSVQVAINELYAEEGVLLSELDPTANVTLMLRPSGLVGGTVVNTDATPVEAAVLTPIENNGHEVLSSLQAALTQETGPQGQFRLEHLWYASWRLRVQAEGYAPLTTDPIEVGTEDARLVLTKGARITGTVVEKENRNPVSNLEVAALPEGGLGKGPRATTDDSGQFAFDLLQAGAYRLDVVDRQYALATRSDFIEVHDSDTVADRILEVYEGGKIRGRVLNDRGREGVPDVEVWAQPVGVLGARKQALTTPPDGQYELAGLTPGRYQVWVSLQGAKMGPGMTVSPNEQAVNLLSPAAMGGVDFVLLRGFSIAGRVVDEDNKTVPKARVVARSRLLLPGFFLGPQSAESNAYGDFILAGFDWSSEVFLHAESGESMSGRYGPFTLLDDPGYGPSGHRYPPSRPRNDAEAPTADMRYPDGFRNVRLVLNSHLDGLLAGQVVDDSGRPMGAIVLARGAYEQANLQTPTDTDGAFVIEVESPATYQLMIGPQMSDGIFRLPSVLGPTVSLKRGEQRTGLRLVYPKREFLTITGRVTDSEGHPVADANVSAERGAVFASTDRSGAYCLEGLAEGSYTVGAFPSGYLPATLEGVPAGSENVNLVLERQPRLEGQILDKRTRQPIVTFQIGTTLVGGRPYDEHSLPNSAYNLIADATGHFSIPVQPTPVSDSGEQRELGLLLRAQGHNPGRFAVGPVQPGQVISGLVLELEPANIVVEGIVRDAAGHGIADAQVFPGGSADRETLTETSVASGPDGTFHLEQISPQTVAIWATHPQYATGSTEVALRPGVTNRVEITLSRPGIIEGRVLHDGQPIENGRVGLNPGRAEPTETDTTGYYRFSNLPPGEYTVGASYGIMDGNTMHFYPGQKVTAVVEPDKVTQVDFAL